MASGLNINPGLGRRPGIDYSMINFLDPAGNYGHFERSVDNATGFADNTQWVPAGIPAPAGAPTSNDFYSWAVPDESFGSSFLDFAKNAAPLAAGFLGAGFGLQGLLGAGGLGGDALAGGAFDMGAGGVGEAMGLGGGSTTGGSMWDWLDQLIGNSPDIGAENVFGYDAANPWSNPLMPPAVPESPAQLQEWGLQEVSPGNWAMPNMPTSAAPATDWLSKINSLKSLLGGASGIGGSNGGSRLGQITSDPLGSAFNATPFLLALAQANKQGGDLDQVLSQINGQGYTQSVLNPYDMQTAAGRTALTDSLTNRGVIGSSFGYNDLNNFDYMRAMGRGDLASKAGLASAGLQGNLINQRNTNKNLLLGAGLNASGRLFSPQKDPFNLAALMGG